MKVDRKMSADAKGMTDLYDIDCQGKVLIIVTGGTFIMAPTSNGLEVQPGYLCERMAKDDDFHHASLPPYDIYEWSNPLDSSCVTHNHWMKLAKEIASNYDKYDGFIVLHGTDTMSYTCSALSFMLENLNKPVVVTGAQIPIGEVFNDAKNNLIASLCVAGQCEICEVCLMFNNKLFRGNRSTKVDAWHQNAYDSPNFSPLGLFGIDLEMDEELFLAAPRRKFQVFTKLFSNIIVIWLTPGFSGEMLDAMFNSNNQVKALVLGFYGIGKGLKARKLYNTLKKAKENKNSEIVLMSQCQKGYVDIKSPKSEKESKESKENEENNETMFEDLDVMNAGDMTVEAVVTKLSYLMGKGLRGNKLKRQFETNLRGELTPFEDEK